MTQQAPPLTGPEKLYRGLIERALSKERLITAETMGMAIREFPGISFNHSELCTPAQCKAEKPNYVAVGETTVAAMRCRVDSESIDAADGPVSSVQDPMWLDVAHTPTDANFAHCDVQAYETDPATSAFNEDWEPDRPQRIRLRQFMRRRIVVIAA